MLFEFPEPIKYIIFGYCFDEFNRDYEDIFTKISAVYIAKIFNFNDRIMPGLFKSCCFPDHENMFSIIKNFDIFGKCKIPESASYLHCWVTKKEIGNIKVKNPILFDIKCFADSDRMKKFEKLLKNSQNISLLTSCEDLPSLSEFKAIKNIRLNGPLELDKKLVKIPGIKCLNIETPVIDTDIFILLNKIYGYENSTLTEMEFKLAINHFPFYNNIPKSVTKLIISDLTKVLLKFGKSYISVFKGMDLTELTLKGYYKINIPDVPDSDIRIFPESLKYLKIGNINRFSINNKSIFPKNLKFLSINISADSDKLPIGIIPQVETLIIRFNSYTPESLKEIFIPKSVSNLILVEMLTANFDTHNITFENPDNLRSLAIIEIHSIDYEMETQINKILEKNKLESLIISHNIYSNIGDYKLSLKIPGSLKIILSTSDINLTGDFSGMMYIGLGTRIF